MSSRSTQVAEMCPVVDVTQERSDCFVHSRPNPCPPLSLFQRHAILGHTHTPAANESDKNEPLAHSVSEPKLFASFSLRVCMWWVGVGVLVRARSTPLPPILPERKHTRTKVRNRNQNDSKWLFGLMFLPSSHSILLCC